MLELGPTRKNKVNLAEYNCQQDIENRMFLADFSARDREVLEEILFSPLKFSLKKLARNTGIPEEVIHPILAKLASAGLLSIEEDAVTVDKEMRKYFECQLARFSPDFRPDMEFLQTILRKVPIHLLPSWYAIPRTSNNIFESIVEKYLLTPQIYQRYLAELHFTDARVNGIVQELFAAPDFKISSSDLIVKYNLARKDFEEIILLLEFYFICCLTFEQEGDHWTEYVSPFHEWHQYLRFLKETDAPSITKEVMRQFPSDFAFIEEMTEVLTRQKKPSEGVALKLCMLGLAEKVGDQIKTLPTGREWLEMTSENKAIYIYRHPHNQITSVSLPARVATERNIREAERSIKRVLHGKWVYFDDFLKGVLVPLSEASVVVLKKTGRHWKYTLPTYTEEEKQLLHAIIFEWLFETGITAIGTCQGKECFCVTPFGRFFFED